MIFLALLTALWLGLLTAIAPCPLATNLAAIMYISKELQRPIGTLYAGLLYAAGRSLVYVMLSVLIILGALEIPAISTFLQHYLNQILGPLLIVAGMILLDLLNLPFFQSGSCARIGQRFTKMGYSGTFFIGIIFAASFCPSSAALFFGGLIPLAIEKKSMAAMPLIYGLGTALPVIAISILIASGFRGLGKLVQKLSSAEKWARLVNGILFIIIGIYYITIYIFELI